MRGRLHFTIGLAQSGKSTHAYKWVRNQDHPPDCGCGVWKPRVVLSGDQFRLALHGKVYEALAECQVFASMDQAARALINSGHDVMMDETATTPETIKRYLRIDIDAIPHFIVATPEVCIQRALKNNKPYLVEPIKRMAKQLERLQAEWPQIFYDLKDEVRARFHQDLMNTH